MAHQTERKRLTNAEIDEIQRWLAAHPEVLAGYENQWVAVADERVLAHGESMGEVEEEARRQGYDEALLVPVMPYPWV